MSEHGSASEHGSRVHGNVSSDLRVNVSTSLADFNAFIDDPEVANYKKIQHFNKRYLYVQFHSKF